MDNADDELNDGQSDKIEADQKLESRTMRHQMIVWIA